MVCKKSFGQGGYKLREEEGERKKKRREKQGVKKVEDNLGQEDERKRECVRMLARGKMKGAGAGAL